MLSGLTPDQTAIPLGGKAAMQVGRLRLREAIRKRSLTTLSMTIEDQRTLFQLRQLLKPTFHRISAVKLYCYIPFRDFLRHNS